MIQNAAFRRKVIYLGLMALLLIPLYVVGHPAVGSIADIARVVGEAARSAGPGDWVIGLGWDPGYLAECLAGSRRFPHRRDLDEVAPGVPVCLTDFSSHMVWANSAALRRCGPG